MTNTSYVVVVVGPIYLAPTNFLLFEHYVGSFLQQFRFDDDQIFTEIDDPRVEMQFDVTDCKLSEPLPKRL